MSQAEAARVYSIAPTAPFLKTLVAAILAGRLPCAEGRPPGPLELSKLTVLFPSRRACRAAEAEFLRQAGEAVLLPRMRAVADVDEARLLALGLIEPLPPAISDLERQLVLTDLVRKWSATLRAAARREAKGAATPLMGEITPAQAAALAGELMELMDTAEVECADLSQLATLVRADFAAHWQTTLDFLEIITTQWPQFLASAGAMSRAARQGALIRAEARRLADHGREEAVIIAGEIGGVAATAELMRVVATLPKGAVVLPGLDMALDEASFAQIVPDHPEHPQYGLCELLERLQISRGQVVVLAPEGASQGAEAAAAQARLHLLSEMMRPAAATDKWAELGRVLDAEALRQALAPITCLAAAHPEEEAEVIALILRQSAERAGETAALVTPDRMLARRVRVRLAKWGVGVDDSGGIPLAGTPVGAYLDHVIEVVHGGFAPAALLSLLKHPLTRLGRDERLVRAAARTLELAALRVPRGEDGLYPVKSALKWALRRFEQQQQQQQRSDKQEKGEAEPEADDFVHLAVRRLSREDFAAAEEVLVALEEQLAPLLELFKRYDPLPLRQLVAAHRQVAEDMASDAAGDSARLWGNDYGQAMARFFEALLDEEMADTSITAREYAGLYRGLMAREVVRSGRDTHDRLFIWGPMEARIQSADVVILGGLNEGTWPQAIDSDAWLSRPMRAQLGLSQPERKIGRAAHDFCQAFGARRLYLTRAQKVDGVPAVPSRWLLRLEALAAGAGLQQVLQSDPATPWLHWAAARDRAPALDNAKRPEPRPPLAARPRQLSVSRVEEWIGNPYAIFARSIMKFAPLPELGPEPDAALRGSVVHAALHKLSRTYPDQLPDNAAEELVAFMDERLREFVDHPRVAAFWRTRFARFAAWFAASEPERRADLARHLSEVKGKLVFETEAGPFTLVARADRLDLGRDGTLAIFDYKTGRAPTKSAIESLQKPQLPLEAAIANAGGFEGLDALSVAKLSFIEASGKEEPGTQEDRGAAFADSLGEKALAGLKALVTAFEDENQPYVALRRPGFDYRFDDFEHLARVKEWLVEDAGEGA